MHTLIVDAYHLTISDKIIILTLQLGVVFLEQGKASQALAYLDKALEFDPEHEQALLNSAILLQELGRAELRKIARERLLKLLSKDGMYGKSIQSFKKSTSTVLVMHPFHSTDRHSEIVHVHSTEVHIDRF